MVTGSYILEIERKLCNREPLNDAEIRSVISALRESGNCLQTPYYEVVYHDEYDHTERRIMEPISHSESPLMGNDKYYISQDRFELNFNRMMAVEK